MFATCPLTLQGSDGNRLHGTRPLFQAEVSASADDDEFRKKMGLDK